MSTLKHHHIKIKEWPTQSDAQQWESFIQEVHGVSKVNVDLEKGDVFVEYDIHNCCEEAIEHWLEKAGFILDDSFLQKVKRGFIHYTEENARENLSAKPHSCHDLEK